MAVHLIIDGYNLIRQSAELEVFEAQDLQSGRQALLQKLAAYRRVHHHPITVVFDGWESGGLEESRDYFQGILVIYSRRGEQADEVIKRLAGRERQRALVVTSDRDVLNYVEHHGATPISAPEFEFRLQLVDAGHEDFYEFGEKPVTKHTRKKGPAHRAPKKKRRQRQRLKKL
jgi:predicted RNA-binding protein with PIN domain